jgi:short-subunit dehydrogenase
MTQPRESTRPVALVTGASSGIGLAFAQVFAEHGYDLVLVARSSMSLNKLATELKEKHGAQAFVIPCDLSDPASAENLHAEVLRRGIQIDALVNNAGFNFYGPFAEIELATDMDMIQVNLTSLVVLTKLFLRDMVSRKAGRILNVGSTASFGPAPNVSLYAATKAFVLSFSEGLSEEVKGTGVTVGVLCPGSTRTEFAARAGMLNTKIFSGELMSARAVAETGFLAMMQGRMTTITGFANKFQVWSMRFAPRAMVVRIAKGLLSRSPIATPQAL